MNLNPIGLQLYWCITQKLFETLFASFLYGKVAILFVMSANGGTFNF